MHHPLKKAVGMLCWFVTGVASANELTAMWGYDLMSYIVRTVPGMEQSLIWIIGIAGFISLIMLFMGVIMGCGACACACNGDKCQRCGCSPCMCKPGEHNRMKM